MRTTTFGAAFRGDGSRFRHFQQVIQLQRFNARGVEWLALVIQVRVGNPLTQIGLAVPLVVLYVVSIGLAYVLGKPREEPPEPDVES